VDDCVVGVWAGAMLAIIGYWAIRWFEKRNWQFPYRDSLLMVMSIASVGFMYMGDLHYDPTVYLGFLYIDSFLFTTILGAITFILAMNFYEWMKKKNGGHAHFPFEKVVVPVVALCLTAKLFSYLAICTPALPDFSNL
jgi:hypothetical protein